MAHHRNQGVEGIDTDVPTLFEGYLITKSPLAESRENGWVPSGEHTKSTGKSPFLMGKSTISMAIFHCYVSSPEGNAIDDFNGLYWESGTSWDV